MRLSALQLTDYRNYPLVSCAFSPGVTMVVGANAQGKTNLLESIYYLSIGKAYRQARDEQLVRWGARAFCLQGHVESKKGDTTIEIQYRMDESPAKVLVLDGLRREKGEELSGALTSVFFSPESMSIVKGAPVERRRFLDYDIAQISLAYSRDMARYRRIVAQRNALLKKLRPLSMPIGRKKEQLALWDRQSIEYAGRIVGKRLAFLEKISPIARLTQRRLTEGKENLTLRYVYAADKYVGKNGQDESAVSKETDIEAYLTEACGQALEDDLRFGATQWGPHRDDLRILLDGADVRQYGSQGQQRTSVLALKLAELEVFRGESGEYPILLLDDVLSELDGHRQKQLLSIIREKSIQCVITATQDDNESIFDPETYKRFSVRQGEIREI